MNRSVSRGKKTHPRILAPFWNSVIVMIAFLPTFVGNNALIKGIAHLNLKLPASRIHKVVDKERRHIRYPLKIQHIFSLDNNKIITLPIILRNRAPTFSSLWQPTIDKIIIDRVNTLTFRRISSILLFVFCSFSNSYSSFSFNILSVSTRTKSHRNR